MILAILNLLRRWCEIEAGFVIYDTFGRSETCVSVVAAFLFFGCHFPSSGVLLSDPDSLKEISRLAGYWKILLTEMKRTKK
jgi:hypothetical protein